MFLLHVLNQLISGRKQGKVFNQGFVNTTILKINYDSMFSSVLCSFCSIYQSFLFSWRSTISGTFESIICVFKLINFNFIQCSVIKVMIFLCNAIVEKFKRVKLPHFFVILCFSTVSRSLQLSKTNWMYSLVSRGCWVFQAKLLDIL